MILLVLQCFHVPYSALTMFLSTDQQERDSATAYRKDAKKKKITAHQTEITELMFF